MGRGHPAKDAAETETFDVVSDKTQWSDKMAMVPVISKVNDVNKEVFRAILERIVYNYQDFGPPQSHGLDTKLKACLDNFCRFEENWLAPYIHHLEGELELNANFDTNKLTKYWRDEVDNKWLPSLYSKLHKR